MAQDWKIALRRTITTIDARDWFALDGQRRLAQIILMVFLFEGQVSKVIFYPTALLFAGNLM